MVLLGGSAEADLPRFEAPFRALPSAAYPYNVAAGDLNGDGRPDLVALSSSDHLLSIHLNADQRRFASYVTLPLAPGFRTVLLGDLDGDGDADAVILSQTAAGVLECDGNGTLQSPVLYAVPTLSSTFPLGMLRDVEPDGDLDLLVVGGSPSRPLALLRNAGDGTFAPYTIAVANGSTTPATGDLNGDGHLDVVTAACNLGCVAIHLGNGDGTFAAPSTSPPLPGSPYSATSLGVGDFDGDAHFDVAVGMGGGIEQPGLLAVLSGNGDGTLDAPTSRTGGASPLQMLVRDFDHDGDDDVVTFDMWQSTGGTMSVFANAGGGAWAPVRFQVAPVLGRGVVADVDGDGHADVIASARYGYAIALYYGNGDGTFGVQRATPLGARPASVALGDLDHDGVLDAAGFRESPGEPLWAALGIGDAAFAPPTFFASSTRDYAVQLDAIGGDTDLDLVSTEADVVMTHPWLGGGFGAASSSPAGPRADSPVTADFDLDDLTDVLVVNRDSTEGHKVSLLRGNGGGAFDPPVAIATLPRPLFVKVADFDDNDWPDAVIRYNGVGVASLLLGGPTGLAPRVDVPLPSANFVTGDLDADGRDDLVVQVGDYPQDSVRVLLGNGDGTFTAVPATPAGFYASPSSVRDLDGDGHADLILSTSLGYAMYVMPGRGDGTFETSFVWHEGGWGGGPGASGDLDLDGRPDFVSGHYFGSQLVALRNVSGITTDAGGGGLSGRAGVELAGFVPNPSRGAPTIEFTLARSGPAMVEVFDVSGRQVFARRLGVFEPGPHRVAWTEGARSRSGVYFVRVTQGTATSTRRGVLVR
jgi:hypothetical protein